MRAGRIKIVGGKDVKDKGRFRLEKNVIVNMTVGVVFDSSVERLKETARVIFGSVIFGYVFAI